MRSALIAILTGGIVLLLLSSCATVPTQPLGSGEVRLLKIGVLRGEPISFSVSYTVDIDFEADGKPEIQQACFYLSGDGPNCFRITDVRFGPPGIFEVRLPGLDLGSYRLECYAEYTRGGETVKTNSVGTQISVGR
jgi:hypothetical protein